MHIVVTGANGFIGRQLLATLLSETQLARHVDLRVTAVDLRIDEIPEHKTLQKFAGSFADADLLQTILKVPADLVFHLASVPSGLSEQDPELGLDVNVHGLIRLLDALKAQGNCPTLVFASSIAVYGKPQVPIVTDDTLPSPMLSYGAHKVIGEVLVTDYIRRGWIKGCSIRLPGIVARPPEPNGAISIFLSNLIRELAQGKPFVCPTSSEAQSWLMSVRCCVRNLMYAATIETGSRRTFMLPALHVTLKDLVAAIGRHTNNPDIDKLITWEADPFVQTNFGSYPPLQVPLAEALGFRSDKDLDGLVADSLGS
ncbi:MAG: NAD-dependent epimerase/dehydratase family protein [Pseudomonadota bacterium]